MLRRGDVVLELLLDRRYDARFLYHRTSGLFEQLRGQVPPTFPLPRR